MNKMKAGESTVEKIFEMSEDETQRRHVSLAMKHAELNTERFNAFYGYDVLERFSLEFETLETLAIIQRTPGMIRYTPEYADLSDRFVRLFYSQQVNSRIRAGVSERDKRNAFSFTV